MKTLIKYSLLILCFTLGGKAVLAQQDAAYSMYMFNGLYINPAYAGSKDYAVIDAIYRHQWAGVDGAPRSASVGINSPFKKKQYAIGAIYSFDKIGLTQMNSMYLSYAYRLRFKNNLRLAFGIQAGFTYYANDLSFADLPNQGAVNDLSFAVDEQLFLPNFGFGIWFHSDRFYVGISVPHLLTPNLSSRVQTTATDAIARQYNHYLATGGVLIGANESWIKFKPSFLLKFLPEAPMSWDANMGFLFIDRFWLATSFRFGGDITQNGGAGNAIAAMAEFKVTPQLRIGYAYDHSLSKLVDFNSGSHEIMLGYDFGFDMKRYANPRYIRYF